MKHAKKENRKVVKQKKVLKVLLVLLAITSFVAAVTIYRDYQARPGFLKKIWIDERGADYLIIAWERPRNIYRYTVTYNGETKYVSGMSNKVKLTHLTEDTEYEIAVRADSRQRQGFEELSEKTKTKKWQKIKGEKKQMKFANIPVDLKQTAETELSFTSNNKSMQVTGDKVVFTRPGRYVVQVHAEDSQDYVAANKKIVVNVLDSVSVDASGATPHIFYNLNKDNCELVKTVTGTKTCVTPQSFAYIDGEYIILYVSKGNTSQRIICFGEGKTVIKPGIDFGHCNGLTVADGRFYMVRGRGPDGADFDLSIGDYNHFVLPNYAAGVAYDEKNEMFFTSQLRVNATYDKDFKEINHFKRIKRDYKHYSQDCGAYGGIMMHCVSGTDVQGENYIDFYDMIHQKYLGSIGCQLNEVESLIVDDEGYIVLLCNTKSYEDYIWKTPINMKMLTG